MKKIMLFVFMLLLGANLNAANFIKGGYYGGVGLGLEDYSYYSNYDPGVTLVLNGGKPIIKLGPGTIGAEVEFTYTVLPMDYSKYDWSVSTLTLGTYATYTYKHTKKFYSRAKFGLVLQHTTWDYDDDDYYDDYDYDYNHGAVALGIGGGYNFTKKLRAYSDFIVMSGGIKQLNFGLQMSF